MLDFVRHSVHPPIFPIIAAFSMLDIVMAAFSMFDIKYRYGILDIVEVSPGDFLLNGSTGFLLRAIPDLADFAVVPLRRQKWSMLHPPVGLSRRPDRERVFCRILCRSLKRQPSSVAPKFADMLL